MTTENTTHKDITLDLVGTRILDLMYSHIFNFLHHTTDNRNLAHYLSRNIVVHTGLRGSNINQLGLLRYIRILTFATINVAINSIIGLITQALAVALIAGITIPYKMVGLLNSFKSFLTRSENNNASTQIERNDTIIDSDSENDHTQWVNIGTNVNSSGGYYRRSIYAMFNIFISDFGNNFMSSIQSYSEELRAIDEKHNRDSYFVSATEKFVLSMLLNRTHIHGLLSSAYNGDNLLIFTLKIGLAVLNWASQCLMLVTVPIIFVLHTTMQTLYNVMLKITRSSDIFKVSDFDEFSYLLSATLECKGTSLDGHKETVMGVLNNYIELLQKREIIDDKSVDKIKQTSNERNNKCTTSEINDAEDKWNKILIQLPAEDREIALLLKLVLHADHQYMNKDDSREKKVVAPSPMMTVVKKRDLEVVKCSATNRVNNTSITTENILDMFKYHGIEVVKNFLNIIKHDKRIIAKKQLLDKEFENICRLNGIGDIDNIRHFMKHHMFLYPAVGNNLAKFVAQEEMVTPMEPDNETINVKEPKLRNLVEFFDIKDVELQKLIDFCVNNAILSESNILCIFVAKGEEGLKNFFSDHKIDDLYSCMVQAGGEIELSISDICTLKRVIYLLNVKNKSTQPAFTIENVVQMFTQNHGFTDDFKIITLKLEFFELLNSSTDYYEREFCRFLLQKGLIDDSIFNIYYADNENVTANMIMRDLHLQFSGESKLTDDFIVHSALKELEEMRATIDREESTEEVALDCYKAEILLHYFMRYARNADVDLMHCIRNSLPKIGHSEGDSTGALDSEAFDQIRKQITTQALFLHSKKKDGNIEDILFFLFLLDESTLSVDNEVLLNQMLAVEDNRSFKKLENNFYQQLDQGWIEKIKDMIKRHETPGFNNWIQFNFNKMGKISEFNSLTGFRESDEIKKAYKEILIEKIKNPFNFESRRHLFRMLIALEVYNIYNPEIEMIALNQITSKNNPSFMNTMMKDYCQSLGLITQGSEQQNNLTIAGDVAKTLKEIYGDVFRYIVGNASAIKSLVNGPTITLDIIRNTAPALLTMIGTNKMPAVQIAPFVLEFLNSNMLKSEISTLQVIDGHSETEDLKSLQNACSQMLALVIAVSSTALSKNIPLGSLLPKLILLTSIRSGLAGNICANIAGVIQDSKVEKHEDTKRSYCLEQCVAIEVAYNSYYHDESDLSPNDMTLSSAAPRDDNQSPSSGLFGAMAQGVGALAQMWLDGTGVDDTSNQEEEPGRLIMF
ncbi:hypothetical protein GUI12_01290 [Anaplasmataceae bacterium AB001_6]|nr:hypothetical protein GUI12_01290 [Anaplasmataceae bacterium AB001_6]